MNQATRNLDRRKGREDGFSIAMFILIEIILVFSIAGFAFYQIDPIDNRNKECMVSRSK